MFCKQSIWATRANDDCIQKRGVWVSCPPLDPPPKKAAEVFIEGKCCVEFLAATHTTATHQKFKTYNFSHQNDYLSVLQRHLFEMMERRNTQSCFIFWQNPFSCQRQGGMTTHHLGTSSAKGHAEQLCSPDG